MVESEHKRFIVFARDLVSPKPWVFTNFRAGKHVQELREIVKEGHVAGDAEQNATNNHLAPPPTRRRHKFRILVLRMAKLEHPRASVHGLVEGAPRGRGRRANS